MNKFKDFIEIDKKFQNSINLQLDIDNLSKLNSYIPTHSSILVLMGFLIMFCQTETRQIF